MCDVKLFVRHISLTYRPDEGESENDVIPKNLTLIALSCVFFTSKLNMISRKAVLEVEKQ